MKPRKENPFWYGEVITWQTGMDCLGVLDAFALAIAFETLGMFAKLCHKSDEEVWKVTFTKDELRMVRRNQELIMAAAIPELLDMGGARFSLSEQGRQAEKWWHETMHKERINCSGVQA